MKNLYKSVKSLGRGLLLVGGLTGLAVLTTSCDENKDTLLYETTYQGPVTVQLIQEVKKGVDVSLKIGLLAGEKAKEKVKA